MSEQRIEGRWKTVWAYVKYARLSILIVLLSVIGIYLLGEVKHSYEAEKKKKGEEGFRVTAQMHNALQAKGYQLEDELLASSPFAAEEFEDGSSAKYLYAKMANDNLNKCINGIAKVDDSALEKLNMILERTDLTTKTCQREQQSAYLKKIGITQLENLIRRNRTFLKQNQEYRDFYPSTENRRFNSAEEFISELKRLNFSRFKMEEIKGIIYPDTARGWFDEKIIAVSDWIHKNIVSEAGPLNIVYKLLYFSGVFFILFGMLRGIVILLHLLFVENKTEAITDDVFKQLLDKLGEMTGTGADAGKALLKPLVYAATATAGAVVVVGAGAAHLLPGGNHAPAQVVAQAPVKLGNTTEVERLIQEWAKKGIQVNLEGLEGLPDLGKALSLNVKVQDKDGRTLSESLKAKGWIDDKGVLRSIPIIAEVTGMPEKPVGISLDMSGVEEKLKESPIRVTLTDNGPQDIKVPAYYVLPEWSKWLYLSDEIDRKIENRLAKQDDKFLQIEGELRKLGKVNDAVSFGVFPHEATEFITGEQLKLTVTADEIDIKNKKIKQLFIDEGGQSIALYRPHNLQHALPTPADIDPYTAYEFTLKQTRYTMTCNISPRKFAFWRKDFALCTVVGVKNVKDAASVQVSSAVKIEP